MRREKEKGRNIHFRTVRQRFGGYLLFIGVLWFFFVCPFMSYALKAVCSIRRESLQTVR